MNWLPRSLFGRNLLLIVSVVILGQVTTALVFFQSVQRPRVTEFAAITANQVKALGITLSVLGPQGRERFIRRLNASNSVQIEEGVQPPTARVQPGSFLIRYFMQALADQLGNSEDVIWQPEPAGIIWVRIPLDTGSQWLQLSSKRVAAQTSGIWVLVSLLYAVFALIGAYLIQRRLNQPLQALAAAAEQVGRGIFPKQLPDSQLQEIAAVSRSFNSMTRNLAELDSERALMLAGISHDIRTPLTKLRLNLALLNNGKEPELAAGAERNIEEIDAVISQFMDFARQGSDEAQSGCDLTKLIADLADDFARQGAPFILTVELSQAIAYRPLGMRRMLSNLMQNAARYARAGIELRAQVRANQLELRVCDRGPGVPADQLERLKQPFTRLESARTGPPGSGLGLAIVDRIARLHGGTFTLSLRSGGGLIALVILPLETA